MSGLVRDVARWGARTLMPTLTWALAAPALGACDADGPGSAPAPPAAATPAQRAEDPPMGAGETSVQDLAAGAVLGVLDELPPTPRRDDGAEPDLDRWVTAKALAAQLAQEGTFGASVVVDVRALAEEAQAKVAVPGALAVPRHRLRHAAMGKAPDVLLVGQGHDDAALQSLAESLRSPDRPDQRIRVLHGGMQAWCRAGGPVSPPGADCGAADALPPSALFQAKDDAAWVPVVAVAQTPDSGKGAAPFEARLEAAAAFAEGQLPAARVVTWRDADELARELQSVAVEAGVRMVAVLDADVPPSARPGQLPASGPVDAAKPRLRERVDAHLFFVDGGVRGYDALVARQEAMKTPSRVVSHGRRGGERDRRRASAAVMRAPKGCGCL